MQSIKYVCIYVCMYVCLYDVCKCMYVCIYVYKCMCVCMYINVCTYVCICKRMYACMQTASSSSKLYVCVHIWLLLQIVQRIILRGYDHCLQGVFATNESVVSDGSDVGGDHYMGASATRWAAAVMDGWWGRESRRSLLRWCERVVVDTYDGGRSLLRCWREGAV